MDTMTITTTEERVRPEALATEYGKLAGRANWSMQHLTPRHGEYKASEAIAWTMQNPLMPRIAGFRHLREGNQHWPPYDASLWAIFERAKDAEQARMNRAYPTGPAR